LSGVVLAPSPQYLRELEHPPHTCVNIFTYGTDFDDAEDLHATIVRDLPALIVESKLEKHEGCHPESLFRFIRSEQFPTWMVRLRECILQCRRQRLEVQRCANVQAPSVKIKLAFRCPTGRHNSVAGAIVVRYCLQHLGYECPPIEHFSLWRRQCTCEACLDSSIIFQNHDHGEEIPDILGVNVQGLMYSAWSAWLSKSA
jgi:hypothetical protein